MSMSISGIHGHTLDITVVGGNKLKNTEWLSRQDPYVCLEYGSTKYRTRTCTDGGKHPTFQEKFVFTLIEGLREVNIMVWNSNTLSVDDFIGSGKVQLQKVLSQGYDDSSWSLQTKTGRYAGEVRLIMHYANANKPATNFPPSSAPGYGVPHGHQSHPYSAHPPPAASPYPQTAPPYPNSNPNPSLYSSYPANSSPYPSHSSPYPPPSAPYPSSPYPPPHSSPYPSQPYPPPSGYPSQAYPPSSHGSSPYPPQGPYPGTYPPPPY